MLTTSRRCRLARCLGRQGSSLGDSWRILAMTRVVLSTVSSLPFTADDESGSTLLCM